MASSIKHLTLDDENWGERVHRAYRVARDAYGGEKINYRAVAERIAHVFPCSMTSLQRLEHYEEVPAQPRVRLMAFYALVAYGFDPAEFEITPENTPLSSVDLRKTTRLLNPTSPGSSVSDLSHEPIRRNAA